MLCCTVITAEETNVEMVEDFCYLGSYISRTGSCDKECMVRIGKAASSFGRLSNIWKNKNIITPYALDVSSDKITDEKVARAIRKLKNVKAAGSDHI